MPTHAERGQLDRKLVRVFRNYATLPKRWLAKAVSLFVGTPRQGSLYREQTKADLPSASVDDGGRSCRPNHGHNLAVLFQSGGSFPGGAGSRQRWTAPRIAMMSRHDTDRVAGGGILSTPKLPPSDRPDGLCPSRSNYFRKLSRFRFVGLISSECGPFNGAGRKNRLRSYGLWFESGIQYRTSSRLIAVG